MELWAEWQLDYEGHAAWSPDSQHIAFSDDNIYGIDDWTYMFNVNTPQPVWKINDSMSSITFSPDGKYIVSSDRRLRFFDAASGEMIKFPYEGNAQLLPVFSPNGTTLLVGRSWLFSEEDTLTEIGEWDDERNELNIFLEQEGYLNAMTLSPDGKQLATSFAFLPGIEGDRGVLLWDLITRSKHCDLPGEHAIFSPMGDLLATSNEGNIILFDSLTCQSLETIHVTEYISSMSFNSDGRVLASAGIPSSVIWIHDTATGELVYQQDGLSEFVIENLAFSPDGQFLMSVNREMIQIWKVTVTRE